MLILFFSLVLLIMPFEVFLNFNSTKSGVSVGSFLEQRLVIEHRGRPKKELNFEKVCLFSTLPPTVLPCATA